MMLLLALAVSSASAPPIPPLTIPSVAAARASRPTPSLEEQKARGAKCAGLAKNDPAKAEGEARDWITNGFGGLPARQCLGIAQAGLEQWPASAATFEAAAKDAQIAQNPLAVVLWMQAGNAALAGDDPMRAHNDMDRTLALPGLSDQMRGEVFLDRARAGVAVNDLVSAKADLEQATKLVPGDALGWLLRANLARKMKDMPLAFSSIREAATLSPNDPSVSYEAGNIAAAAGQMDDARAAWTRAAQAAPDSDAGQAAALALKGGDSGDAPAKP